MIQPKPQPLAAPPREADLEGFPQPPKYWCCRHRLIIIQIILTAAILTLGHMETMGSYQGMVGGSIIINCAIVGIVVNVK